MFPDHLSLVLPILFTFDCPSLQFILCDTLHIFLIYLACFLSLSDCQLHEDGNFFPSGLPVPCSATSS